MSSYHRGIWAEYYSCAFLMLKGYWPRRLRYKAKVGEVDLVAKRFKSFVFVEVKYRDSFDDGAYAISLKSQSRIRRAAEQYLLENQKESSKVDLDVRFDAVIVSKKLRIKHIQNAF